jgi:hypothetical protein
VCKTSGGPLDIHNNTAYNMKIRRKSTRKRPVTKDAMVAFRMPSDIKDALARVAAADERPISFVVLQAIKSLLRERGVWNGKPKG